MKAHNNYNPFLFLIRGARPAIVYLLVFCIVNMPAWALSGFNAIGGSASYNGSDTVTLNQLRAVIEWYDFNTAEGQLIQFLDGGPLTVNHAVLNRVTSGSLTQFDGILQGGQGHILLINPAGIMFGSTAEINAGRFTASTMHLQMSDVDFMAGASDTFEFVKDGADPAASIELVAGTDIIAQRVDLLAQQITNGGTITTGNDGVVVMAAGDRVLLGQNGSNVIIEMSGFENSMITNNGTIEAPEGTIVLAAGDIFSTPLGLKVFDGAGKVYQNGILDVDGTNSGEGDGGTIEMLAGEEISIGTGSLTSANAIPDGLGTDRPDGGDIIIESSEIVNIDPDAYFSAKGNGWYDADLNFRFDFGIDTSFSGSIQIFGKYLNLPSPDDYLDPAEFSNHFDLLGYNIGPLQQLQSGVLTVGNNEGDMIVAEGPLPGNSAENTVYEEWIEDVSLVGVHVDTLSFGSITIEDLNPGDAQDLGLIGGAGNMSFRTRFDTGGIVVSDRTDIIGTLDGGDIFMAAGSGGITTGAIGIRNEDKTGDPGQIILATANGGDIDTLRLDVNSGNREIISILSSGDVRIDGGVFVATNEVPDAIDKTATAEICIQAGDDIDINGPIDADSHGKVAVLTDIHIDAGLNEDETDPGIINIDLQGGQIFAKSEVSGPDPDDQSPGDLISVATIEVHTSAVGEDVINITNGKSGGSQAVQVRAKVQGKPPLGESLPANDPTDYSESVIGPDGGVIKTQIAKIEIQSGYDVSECDDCVPPPFLPPQPEFFLVKNDQATVDWRAGYTIIGDQTYAPADLDVLLNDNGLDDQGDPIPLFDAMIVIDSLETDKGGTLEWVEFQYTDGDGILHIYDGFVYTPPSYTEDFEWDGVSDYATFTDTFQYRGYKEASDSFSLNIATVTITVQNEVPTLTPDSDSIHMNTASNPSSADFDLSALVTDNDGTPGELADPDNFIGDYGDLSYGIVEGLIPVVDGSIATDSGSIPDTLTISGDTITYAPLDGYVSPGGVATTFGYSVIDENIVDNQGDPAEQTESLEVIVTNTLPSGAVILEDAPMNADGEVLAVDSGDFSDADDPFAIVSIDPAIDDNNKTFGGTLIYNGQNDPYVSGDDYTYTADAALPGYVGEDDFDVKLWDGQTTYYADGSSVVLETDYGQGTIDVLVVNDLPEGDSWLGTTEMDTPLNDASLATDGFTDINGDDILGIEIDGISSDDYNSDFGGSLTYDGTDYDYDPSAMGLPGYVGDDIDDFDDGGYIISDNADDRFDVKLWDGQKDYVFKQVNDEWVIDTENTTNVYGSGTISVDITNELPEGDAWFGQVHMDSQGVTQDLEVDFNPGIIVDPDSYTGSVIGSDLFGGTLVYDADADTWTYSTDLTLPGYVGDDNDDFGQASYTADDLFTVNLSNGQYDYWFGEGPAPDGYEEFEYADGEFIYRKTIFSDGTGTVSVDITNVLPTIDEETTIEHMNENIVDQLFASDQLDPNPIVELDNLTTLDSSENPTSIYISDFGITVNLTDNGDGTYSYTYDPAVGYVDEDSFEVTVWDGQINYVFTNGGEIDTEATTKETVSGTVSLEYTNILPSGSGDLGSTQSGTVLTLGQTGVTSPVLVIDIPDLPQQSVPDVLSIPSGVYVGDNGGTLVFDGTSWTYTPVAGFEGVETFTINVWDGQNEYGSHIEEGILGPVYGQGIVTVTVSPAPPPPPTPTPEPPLAPIAPLADYEIPRLVGCPVELDAAATELSINSDQLQLLIANAMATNPSLQPCEACQNLLTAASTLQRIDEASIAALVQIFNSQAPPDMPFTPEASAMVAVAFAEFQEMEPRLAQMSEQEYNDYQQYSMANELIEAFVSYVAVLENDLKVPIGDSMAMVMEKYFEPIEETDNPLIANYLITQMEAVRTVIPESF